MRFILMADIHGNYEAFKAVVSNALENYRSQITGFIFLGDYVCDFLNGHEVVSLMKKLQEKYLVYCIGGNRENMTREYQRRLENGEEMWDINTSMGGPLLACQKMDKSDLDFLNSLPDSQIVNIDGCKPFFLHHKMPLTLEQLAMLNQKDINLVLTGHTHEIHKGKYEDIELYNPGAVGLTDNGIPGADYGVMTWKNNNWHFENKHIDYDYERAIESVKEEPLLFEKCKNWGTALIAAIKTGVNVPALYMFEAKRLAALKAKNSDDNTSKSMVDDNFFGNGRYGNVSPFGTQLKESIFHVDNYSNYQMEYQYMRTDEGKKSGNYQIDDETYEVALRNVINYLQNFTKKELELEVYNGRRTR